MAPSVQRQVVRAPTLHGGQLASAVRRSSQGLMSSASPTASWRARRFAEVEMETFGKLAEREPLLQLNGPKGLQFTEFLQISQCFPHSWSEA